MDLNIDKRPNFARTLHELFHGRQDTWGLQVFMEGNISYRRIRGKTMIPDTYYQHLIGEDTIGIYPLLANGKCFCACLDVDEADFLLARKASAALPRPNHIERSRSGHYHIWMFFKKEIDATIIEDACRGAIDLVKSSSGHHCNLYPLPAKQSVGMLIALPFQAVAVAKDRTIFVDRKDVPYPDQYNYLREILAQGMLNEKILTHFGPDANILKDKKLSGLYLGTDKDVKDRSASGYDFALCKALAERGQLKHKIMDILKQRPLVSKTEESYITRTVEAAWEAAGRNIDTSTVYKDTPAMLEEAKAPPIRICDWDELEEIDHKEYIARLKKSLIIEDIQEQQIDMFYAVVVANLRLQGAPVWLLIIGPPGCGKTISMQALRNSPYVYMTSNLRPTALISGFGLKGKEDVSLIPRLDGKILMVKDMSSLLSQNREVLAEVLGLLRDAYDGACGRSFGTGVERAYNSRFGFIGATTPDIDVNWSLNVRLGERFIRWRVKAPQIQVRAKIQKALETLNEEVSDTVEQEDASLAFLKYLVNPARPMPTLADQKRIAMLAEIGSILRTSVARGFHSNEVLVMPEWEEGTRYAKQLAKVAMSLAHVRGKTVNGEEEFHTLRQIVRDSLDGRVARICQILYHLKKATSLEISRWMQIPDFTVKKCLEDMAVCKVCIRSFDIHKRYIPNWEFVPWIRGAMTQLKLWPADKYILQDLEKNRLNELPPQTPLKPKETK